MRTDYSQRGAQREALLLDALGTLVALEPPAPALVRELAERFEIEVTPEQAQLALAAEIAYYRSHLDEGADADSLAALRLRCAEALRSALPRSAALAALDTASLTEALLASLRFSAFADVRGALLAARARGERVIVVSNWDVSLEAVLERLGLAGLLDAVLTSAAVGARKPSPIIFQRALELAGCSADRALHVGDSFAEDVIGARAAGIEAVLLDRGATGGAGAGSSGSGKGGRPGVQTIASLAQLSP